MFVENQNTTFFSYILMFLHLSCRCTFLRDKKKIFEKKQRTELKCTPQDMIIHSELIIHLSFPNSHCFPLPQASAPQMTNSGINSLPVKWKHLQLLLNLRLGSHLYIQKHFTVKLKLNRCSWIVWLRPLESITAYIKYISGLDLKSVFI